MNENDIHPIKNSSKSTYLYELDVYRGIAAIFMIVNHSGNELISPKSGTTYETNFLIFIGSFAPALFFLTTGFGVAISGRVASKNEEFVKATWKCFILILADQLFCWNDGLSLRLDFFSFTAISTIILTLLNFQKNAIPTALILTVALVGSRYGLAPNISDIGSFGPVTHWFLGTPGVKNISYPLSPWMTYPLIGFIAGKYYVMRINSYCNAWKDRIIKILLLVALIFLFISIQMFYTGKTFFRWGTVSFAYFILSLSIIVFVGLAANKITKYDNFCKGQISLRGISSFLVIPFHYAIIFFTKTYIHTIDNIYSFITVTLIITSTAFVIAKSTGTAIKRINETNRKLHIGIISIVLPLASYYFSLTMNLTIERELSETILLLSQVTISGLFVYQYPRQVFEYAYTQPERSTNV